MLRPTSRPAKVRIGTGHHVGAESKPRSTGSVVKIHCCASPTPFKK